MSSLRIINNTDPVIVYDPLSSWIRDPESGSMKTMRLNATVVVPFYGNQICVYGGFSRLPVFPCKVDNQSPTDEHDLCKANISLAWHKLTITNLANVPLSIDYFLVSQPFPSSSTYNQSPSNSNSIPMMTPQSTYNQPYQPLPTAVESTTASSRNRVQLIGGTVGGLALLVIVVIFGAWFVKRRRNAKSWKAPSSMFTNASKNNPYWEKHQKNGTIHDG